MDWANKRKIIIIAILAAVAIAFGSIIFVVFTTDSATCFDGLQNGSELGIDCGGGCQLVCDFEVQPLSVSFTQYVITEGRPDVIAHIENTNKSADAVSVTYLVEVYTDEGDLFAQHTGSLDVPHESVRAVFIPRIARIAPRIGRAFLTITDQTFFVAKNGPKITVESFSWEDLDTGPTLSVRIHGDFEESLRRIPFVVTVFDEQNSVLAVSQTVINHIGFDQEEESIFTWNEPFLSPPARVEFIFDTPRIYGDI